MIKVIQQMLLFQTPILWSIKILGVSCSLDLLFILVWPLLDDGATQPMFLLVLNWSTIMLVRIKFNLSATQHDLWATPPWLYY